MNTDIREVTGFIVDGSKLADPVIVIMSDQSQYYVADGHKLMLPPYIVKFGVVSINTHL